MNRKVIQITAIPESTDYGGAVIALCDDGKMYNCPLSDKIDHLGWTTLSDVPQDEDKIEKLKNAYLKFKESVEITDTDDEDKTIELLITREIFNEFMLRLDRCWENTNESSTT